MCEDRPHLATITDVFFAHVLRCSMARQHREKVRAQAEFIAEKIAAAPAPPARVLDVGCGPSLDVAVAQCDPQPSSPCVRPNGWARRGDLL
jgi:hypothetical protein